MDIADVEAHALSSPIEPPQDRQFHGGTRRLRKRDVVLVAVTTKDGERGFAPAGATSSAMREYFEGDSQATIADVIDRIVAPALEGATIDEIGDAGEVIAGLDLDSESRRQAASAIDVALYDVRGRQAGCPVYELLAEERGTTPTTTLDLYASAGMYMEPEGYRRQASILDELGFVGYKYRPGIGPVGDRETVELLAAAVGMEIMIDAHTWWKTDGDAYDADTVRSLVTHAAENDAYWIEEPVAPDDYDGYRSLARTGAPLAGGESEVSAAGLLALGETGAVDFLQGDVRHHGGFTGCWRAIEFCRERDVTFVPHNFGTWLGLVANAHLVAAAPGATLLEYPVFENDPALDHPEDPGMYPFDLAFEVLADTLDVTDGTLTVPDGPGLGVEVNLDVVEAYPFVDGPWTEFHYERTQTGFDDEWP